MTSRSLALASLIVFSYGCAYSYEVTKIDQPEVEKVATPPPSPTKPIMVEATPEDAERTPSTVSVVSNTPDEAAPHVDPEIQQVAEAIEAEDNTKADAAKKDDSAAERRDCGSVSFAKKYLHSNKVKVPEHVGDAKKSVPNWKKGGFKVVKILPVKNQGKPFDICVYDNDQTGDIFVKKTNGQWVNGCGAAPARSPASSKLLACLRKAKRK